MKRSFASLRKSLCQEHHLTGNHTVAHYFLVPTNLDPVFKALADPARRLLLDRLRMESGQTLVDLCGNLEMSRQAVSKHLAILEDAHLVVTIRQGREKLHYLNTVPIHAIADRWIHKFERGRLDALATLKRKLEDRNDG